MSYDPPKFDNEITLKLSSNESLCAMDDLSDQLSQTDSLVPFYPSHIQLQNLIGESLDIDPARIVVTAGGDDAIDRVIAESISGKRDTIVCHTPSFEMFDVYANLYGGRLAKTEWIDGDFPIEAFLESIDDQTALVIVVSPNNPTGGSISTEQILQVADKAKKFGCRLLVDNAYVEFADTDPTPNLAADPNISIVRTFSKAWGLAGLRVGYLIACEAEYATTIRNLSGPYPVSSVSLETARRCLADYRPAMQSNISNIKTFRGMLCELLDQCGAEQIPSQGNFILAKFDDAESVWQQLANDGIGVRKFPSTPILKDRLRITVPATNSGYLQLSQSLCRIFDLDFENQKNELLSKTGFQPVPGSRTGFQPVPDSTQTGPDETQTSPESETGWKPVLPRTATVNRETKETRIDLDLNLDGTGIAEIETGIGFLDHMLTALTFHSRMDMKLKCDGDLEVDDHHTAEDCALALGTAIDQALGKRSGIQRFGFAYAPLDEALARTVIDLSGRPWPEIHLQLQRQMVGTWACENITHFFQSLAMTLKCSLHVDVLRGENDHHRVEAAFKSMAKALRTALTRTAGDVPSTKGVL